MTGKIATQGWYEIIIKGCARYIFASFLQVQKRALVKLGKMFFILLQKFFSFSRKSNFSILDIQISWRYQMPKHKTRNTFYWITWEVNTACWWSLASLSYYYKIKFYRKILLNLSLEKGLVPRPSCFCKEWSIGSTVNWNFWSKLRTLDIY